MDFMTFILKKTLPYEIRLKTDLTRKNEIKNDRIILVNQVIEDNKIGP